MLKRIVGGNIAKAGVYNNQDYFKGKTTTKLDKGTNHDHMMRYLNEQGFSGHPRDAFRAWAQSKGSGGTWKDNIQAYFKNTVSP